jgi:Polysaccharide deacetylase
VKYLKNIKLVGCFLLALLVIGLVAAHRLASSSADRLLLLVPDGMKFSDPKVAMWIDAGNEEGLHVVPVHDSEFLGPFLRKTDFSGLILPDSIHKEASDLLVTGIRRFVAEGGSLMLVYDAGTLSLTGRYTPGQSRFSELAGVKYALYESLRDKTTQWSKIRGTAHTFDEIGVPPGKYYPFYSENGSVDASEVELRRYMYGDLQYPSLVTSGNYDGKVLLHSDAGVVAGERKYQSGSVLFVNLPLGYLKGNTDGLPLHGFLDYFAEHTLALPRLLPVPDGIGGITLNWHIDSNAAIKPLQQLEDWRILEQGPYSVHITAGPDAMEFGDKRGFNVDNNPISQDVIRQYEKLGFSIGSHGGWIHDYFAFHVDNGDPKDLEEYLEWNKHSLERITGKPVVEYSAPDGNQPQWVTKWLEDHGFVAYYFTGDTGMAPTQGYRDGQREGQNIWAFPTLHLNQAAAFEEFMKDNYSQDEIEHWLEAVTTFTVNHRSVRLLYFHPPGILQYRPIIRQWMTLTRGLRSTGQFRWYTMTDLATFLNSRKQVDWKVSHRDGRVEIEAKHPTSLEHQTWFFPASRYTEPKIRGGTGTVTKKDDGWLVVAGSTKTLEFEAQTTGK